ncbi:cytochrome c oxidase assembly protein [Psychromicrobium sp. YIM B11713]|uniref:cytochrome c oxidase assembly protein n=1 Tax=Psychromicrobium sp. YIM B11713 TaxID=3145233 RepID=UPI00374E6ECC
MPENGGVPAASMTPKTPEGIRNPWILLAAVVAALALVAALLFGGALSASKLLDAGPLVRWALPIALMVHNLAVAVVVGALLFAVVILPKDRVAKGRTSTSKSVEEHPAFSRVMALASVAAVVWTLAAIAVLILTYLKQSGLAISGGSDFTRGLVFFMTDIDSGRAWLAICIFAAVVTTLCFGVRALTGLALTLILAVIGMVPQALIGHSASAADHQGAVNSLLLHIVGVALWFGGITALTFISGKLGKPEALTAKVLKRFSSLALFAFCLVFASGVVNASIRVTSWDALFNSPYGQLILIKSVATLLLGAIGFMHRQWIIPQLEKGVRTAKRVLWQLILVELVVMGATSGIAVGLSQSAPPQPTEYAPNTSPAEILSGYPLPPELTPVRWLTEWRMDWLWLAFALGAAVAYLLAVRKLRKRGDSWPIWRAVAWLVGMAALIYVTSGPPSVYGMVLFSAHMVDHMALTMVVPIFLVLGAPVSLALKTLRPRGDGSRGIREWILVIVHSRFSKLVTHPLFAAANFAGSIVIFYYSGLFGYALRDHVGHELMIVHFTITGYLFVLSLIGTDPVPYRFPYPLRLLLLLATMAFHAFFGVAIMSSTALLQASYFGNLGRSWGASALADQQIGGAVAWGIGEVPTVLVAIGVALMWSRSDARETKRKDRAADRNNDADLTAYNNMFAQLAQPGSKQSSSSNAQGTKISSETKPSSQENPEEKR